ncbi:hypothetical protein PPERSA_10534 [Pseudocohnilembus persalinus]|uniref:Uncharacterized protein n=1 Tax=Pseudocohnilembus persalinus TaxID=266149 RepID=A0A0V0R7H6_PSEPJ|nr:hypothetical protein PPERSA_10534 [Pseudocohnilembus persalinus]|eukprot:KRX10435.1 hypothetical protein PPERSA_10534 [Pseudocohnilembus persalinus]
MGKKDNLKQQNQSQKQKANTQNQKQQSAQLKNSKNQNNKNNNNKFGFHHLISTNHNNIKEQSIKFDNNFTDFKNYFEQVVQALEGIDLANEMKNLGEEPQNQCSIISDKEFNQKLQVKLISRIEVFVKEINKILEQTDDIYLIISDYYREVNNSIQKIDDQGVIQDFIKLSNLDQEATDKEKQEIVEQNLEIINSFSQIQEIEQIYQKVSTNNKNLIEFKNNFKCFEEGFNIEEWKFKFQ